MTDCPNERDLPVAQLRGHLRTTHRLSCPEVDDAIEAARAAAHFREITRVRWHPSRGQQIAARD